MSSLPIRVVYVDHTGEMGGAEHLLLRLVTGLPKHRIAPVLVCGNDGVFAQTARESGIATTVMPGTKFISTSLVIGQRKVINPFALIMNAFLLVKVAWAVRRFLRTSNAQIIQTNSTFSHIYGGLAGRLAGIPVVWYFHDFIEPKRLGGAISFLWKALSFLCVPYIIAVSEGVRAGLPERARSQVIYAPLPRAELPTTSVPDLRATLRLSADARLVGFVGRISYVKGLDLLAQAAQQVVEIAPNTHFVIIGEALFNESAYKADLIQLVKNLNIADHWHMTGYLQQVSAAIAQFDVLTLPSRREALGLVLLEAGKARKPVVASRVGGIPEVVVNDETGLLVAPGDTDGLAQALLVLLRDPDLCERLGEKAEERVSEHFREDRYFGSFISLYDRLI